MKNLVYFFLVVLLVGVGGCKKDKCEWYCLHYGTCIDGVCRCASGWSGANCNIETKTIDSFAGNYHMVGYSQVWSGGSVQPPVTIDTIVAITKVDEITLMINLGSWPFVLQGLSYDSAKYVYKWFLTPANYGTLSFQRPFADDSVFHSLHEGGIGGGTNTYLSGIKIH